MGWLAKEINMEVLPKSKALTPNPKDLLGISKMSLGKVSPIAEAHEAFAMMDGVEKYGAYNWRDKPVIASIYLDAALRHIKAWSEGEETAKDSLAHHLGHARANLGILLDALETGNLIDDRPVNETSRNVLPALYERLNGQLKLRRKMREEVKREASNNNSYNTQSKVA